MMPTYLFERALNTRSGQGVMLGFDICYSIHREAGGTEVTRRIARATSSGLPTGTRDEICSAAFVKVESLTAHLAYRQEPRGAIHCLTLLLRTAA